MVRCGPGCKLLWGQAVEAGMGPLGGGVVPPALDDLPCLAGAAEEMFVQACISQLFDVPPQFSAAGPSNDADHSATPGATTKRDQTD